MKFKMKQNTILFIIACCFHFNFAISQSSDSCHIVVKKYAVSVFSDTWDCIKSPVSWNKKEWLIAGGAMTGTALLLPFDKKINQYFINHNSPVFDNLSKYLFEPDGNIIPVLISATLFTTGLIKKDCRLKNVALSGLKALGIATLLVRIPKFIAGRHRPDDDLIPDPFRWEGPKTIGKHESFFSGHTTYAFAFATVISSEFKDKKFIPILAYTLASLTAISRVYQHKHWTSDIFPAAFAGYGIGKLVYNNDKKRIQISAFGNEKIKGIALCIPLDKRFK